jgi:hypothetical protein
MLGKSQITKKISSANWRIGGRFKFITFFDKEMQGGRILKLFRTVDWEQIRQEIALIENLPFGQFLKTTI